ncbi:MAG TPA: polyprenol monophosphomannose synthase [Glaciibacter sp.]|nr:polyprenol monophosphomannose synthase [Glaciibacter sp.]
MRTIVIIPTYNEIDNLSPIVGRIRAAAPEADILIVDDASPDGTGRLADELAEHDHRVTVLHRTGKRGLGPAYLAGFAAAIRADYDAVVEIDADGSHDPIDLPAMLELLAVGNDLVIGSRWVPGGAVKNWPAHRQAISRVGNRYARWMLCSSINDLTAGYRAFRTGALAQVDLDGVSSQGYCFQVELAWRVERAGFRVAEHPIIFVERTAGESKMHAGIVAEALWRVTVWGVLERVRPDRNRSGRTRDD